jgi:murein DD-endopeptidase MepM/ murein hydrolase activator NlpD
VSLPNKDRPVPFNEHEETPAKSSMTETDFEVDHTVYDQDSKSIVPYPSPTATAFSSGPFKASASADSKPQWRGWYQSGWKPTWSYFNAMRPTETHRGWDLFAPSGSKLIAPVGPCYLHFYPNGSVPGYGNVAAFFFSNAGKKYVAIYAHCSAFIGSGDRRINMGDEIAYSGCTTVPSCGIELGGGGRTDHVHVGLYEGENPSDSHGKPIDPAKFFKWSPL